MRPLVLLVALIFVSWAGCAGRRVVTEKTTQSDRYREPYISHTPSGGQSINLDHTEAQKYATHLSEADARRIADETVRTNRGFGGYSCKHVFYEEKPTTGSAGRWILTYAPPSDAPDFEVFIVIDDADGKAKVYR